MDRDSKIRLMQAQKFSHAEDFLPQTTLLRLDAGSRSEVRWAYFEAHAISCGAEAALMVVRHTGWDQRILNAAGRLSKVDRNRVVYYLAMKYGGNTYQIAHYLQDICLQIEVWFPDGILTRARAEELKQINLHEP